MDKMGTLIKRLISGKDSSLSDSVAEALSEELMRLFIDAASRTPDNVNCYEHVEYGVVSDRRIGPPKIQGLKLKGKDLMLSDVLNVLEDSPMPTEVREAHPNLTENEWRAALRMTTIILISLEKPFYSPRTSSHHQRTAQDRSS